MVTTRTLQELHHRAFCAGFVFRALVLKASEISNPIGGPQKIRTE